MSDTPIPPRSRQRGAALFEVMVGLMLLMAALTAYRVLHRPADRVAGNATTIASQMNQAATMQARLLQSSNSALFDIQQIALNAWQQGVSFNACAQSPLCANAYAADGYPIHNTQGGYYEMSSRNLSAVERPDLHWTADQPAPLITGTCVPIWTQNQSLATPAPVNLPDPNNPGNPYIAYTGPAGDTNINPNAKIPASIQCGMFGNPQQGAYPLSMLPSYINAFQADWSVPYFKQDATTLQIQTTPSAGYPGPGYTNPQQRATNVGYIAIADGTTHAPARASATGALIGYQNGLGNGFVPVSQWRNPGNSPIYTYSLSQAGPNVTGAPSPQTLSMVDPQAWQGIVLTPAQLGSPVKVVDPSGQRAAIPSGYFEPAVWSAVTKPMNGLVVKTWRDPPQTFVSACGAGMVGPGITTVQQVVHAIVTDNTQPSGMKAVTSNQIIGSSGTCSPAVSTFTTSCGSLGINATNCQATIGVPFDASGNPSGVPTGTMTWTEPPSSLTCTAIACTDALGFYCTASGACGVSAPASSASCNGNVCSATWTGVPGGGDVTVSGANPTVNPLNGGSFQGIEVNGSTANTGQQAYGTVPVTTCSSNSCSTTYQPIGVGPSGITNGAGSLFTPTSAANTYAPSSTDVYNLMAGLVAGSQYANGVSGSLTYSTCATSGCQGIFTVTPAAG